MKLRRFLLIFCSAVLLLLLVWPTGNIKRTDTAHILESSSFEHPLGTDRLGKDVLVQVIAGCRRSLTVVWISTLISLAGGLVLGLLAGYYGSWLKTAVTLLTDLMLTIPPFIVTMVFMTIFGFSPQNAGVALGLTGIGSYAQQIMVLTETVKYEDYILTEKIIGIRDRVIIFFHLLPNIRQPILTAMGNKAGAAVMTYAGLSYIGLGTDINTPDWGSMIYQYRMYVIDRPGLVFWPALGIFMMCLVLNLLFDKDRGSKGSRVQKR